MRLYLEHIGPLREASIDIADDFILLTGPNGTGKTFAAYCVYGIGLEVGPIPLPLFRELYLAYKKADINSFIEKCEKISALYLKKSFMDNLSNLFAQPIQMFSENRTTELIQGETIHYQKERYAILIDELQKIEQEPIEEGKMNAWIAKYRYFFLNHYIGNSAIFPVERVVLSSLHQSFKPENTDNKLLPRYTKPVRDHLEMLNDMINLSKNTSELAYLAEWLETELLKGKITMSRYGELQYKAANSRIGHSISVSASITKSLASLVFYFRHLAKVGDRIIIDEPELNLHPDNQRIIARFLVRAMNAGVKILISTHSDHLIRELNNLMMLGSRREDKKAKKLMRDYKYKTEDLLDYTKVGAYLFLGDTCEQLPVEETGFEVATIDKAINDQNEASNDIYFSLFD